MKHINYYILIMCLLFSFKGAAQSPETIYLTQETPTDSLQILQWIEKSKIIGKTNPSQAEEMLTQTLRQSKILRFREGIFRSLVELVVYARKKQAFSLGENYISEAFSFFPYHAQADSNLYFQLLNQAGILASKKGEYLKAVKYYYQVLNLSLHKKDSVTLKTIATTYGLITSAYIRIQDSGKVAHYISLTENILKKIDAPQELTNLYLSKAILSFTQQNLKSSHQYNDSVLSRASNAQETDILIKAYNNKAIYFIAEKKYSEAINALKKALELCNDESHTSDRTLAIINMGLAYLRLGNYKKAEPYILSAIEQAEQLGYNDGIIRGHEYLSQIYEHTGEYLKSNEHLKKYVGFLAKDYYNKKQHVIEDLAIKHETALHEKKAAEHQNLIAQQDHQIKRQQLIISVIIIVALLIIIFFSLLFYQKNKLKAAQLQQLKQEKQIALLQHLMEGEEQERKRIAEDLHDGIGGMLAALKMNFTAAVKPEHLNSDTPFHELISMFDETSAEVRRTSHNLMPDILYRFGLVKALERYLSQIRKSSNMEVSFQAIEINHFINKSFELAIYRIVQEAVQNVIKYADAHHLLVQLNHQDDILSILVEDDGNGFSIANEQSGMGLRNIKNRVNSFYGELTLQSEPHKGTLLYIEFDLKRIK